MEVLKSIILPRRPLKQQLPPLFNGGDCGACCLGGLLELKSIEEAYKLHQSGTYYGGKPVDKIHDFSRRTMVDTLKVLASDTGCRGGLDGIPILIDHVVDSVPVWLTNDFNKNVPFGLRHQFEWRDYARALLNGGYYGLAQVQHGGYPNDTPIKNFGSTNHWVMICGWRFLHSLEGESEERKKAGLGHFDEEILIGDSSSTRPLETWVEINEFCNRWGGYSSIWARPL